MNFVVSDLDFALRSFYRIFSWCFSSSIAKRSSIDISGRKDPVLLLPHHHSSSFHLLSSFLLFQTHTCFTGTLLNFIKSFSQPSKPQTCLTSKTDHALQAAPTTSRRSEAARPIIFRRSSAMARFQDFSTLLAFLARMMKMDQSKSLPQDPLSPRQML